MRKIDGTGSAERLTTASMSIVGISSRSAGAAPIINESPNAATGPAMGCGRAGRGFTAFFGTVDAAVLEEALRKVMDLSPSGIRRHLDLNKPIYAKTSAYGHFGRKPGRDGSFSWEKTDLVPALKAAVKAAA